MSFYYLVLFQEHKDVLVTTATNNTLKQVATSLFNKAGYNDPHSTTLYFDEFIDDLIAQDDMRAFRFFDEGYLPIIHRSLPIHLLDNLYVYRSYTPDFKLIERLKDDSTRYCIIYDDYTDVVNSLLLNSFPESIEFFLDGQKEKHGAPIYPSFDNPYSNNNRFEFQKDETSYPNHPHVVVTDMKFFQSETMFSYPIQFIEEEELLR